MIEDFGQKSAVWSKWWGGITPLSEIRMWDFYGGRQWITKYVPRFGKVVEAGCGLGRYVFYLKRLGIDIEGIDFSPAVIEIVNSIKSEIVPEAVFRQADVSQLPYKDSSLSGYISLGVIEHFVDGPDKVLAEAHRVLRPGGVAIVTTPNTSFLVIYRRLKRRLKDLVKRSVGLKTVPPDFFQYEYSPGKLKNYLMNQGFHVSRAEGFDLQYPFCEIGRFSGKNLVKGKYGYYFPKLLEKSWLSALGGQSVVIAVKKAPKMRCFLCGKLSAEMGSLDHFDVPISKDCQKNELARYFKKGRRVQYATPYEINPSVLTPTQKECDYGGGSYLTDIIFETFGFSKNVSPQILIKPEVNIDLAVNHVKPIWRKRIS